MSAYLESGIIKNAVFKMCEKQVPTATISAGADNIEETKKHIKDLKIDQKRVEQKKMKEEEEEEEEE